MNRRSVQVPAVSAVLLVIGLVAGPGPVVGQEAGGEAPDVEYLNSGSVLPTDLPFSEAVRVGRMIYLSGMIGVKPRTLELAPGGIEGEARQTMENIRTVLRAHGSAMGRVVKCTVFMADISEWGVFNAVYEQFFEPPYPARSALGADGLALGARVEVECMARTGEGVAGSSGGATGGNDAGSGAGG